MKRYAAAACMLATTMACGGGARPVPVVDGGPRMDSGVGDGGGADAGGSPDASAEDAGPFDAGPRIDVGMLPPDEPDAGRGDGGGVACADVPEPERPCLTSADCGGMGGCVLPRADGCGPCIGVPDECDEERPCETGVCVIRNAHCTACPARSCEPACTAGSCLEGETCGAGGVCVPQACAAGYTCPRNTECAPASTGADEHGCVALECAADTDCDCGLCIDRSCVEGPGECVMF